ncbi:MAG: hypothetical protein J6V42_06260 [Clostridia bacterium]|nr:hypothetical protein [Clostridia bacterium]
MAITAKKSETKKRKVTISVNQSALYQWQSQNKSALSLIDYYQNKIIRGNWLSSEDRAKYQEAIKLYSSSGAELRKANRMLGGGYDVEGARDWRESLSSLNKGYTAANDYYNQWKDEESYNKGIEQRKAYDNYLRYDSAAGKAEMDRMQKEIDTHWASVQPGIEKTKAYIDQLEKENDELFIYASKGHKESQAKYSENKKRLDSAYAAISAAKAENDALRQALSQKTEYYAAATKVQNEHRIMTEAANLANNSDFGFYAEKGANSPNNVMTNAQGYNKTYGDMALDAFMTAGDSTDFKTTERLFDKYKNKEIYDLINKYASDGERKSYAAYLGMGETEKADEYLRYLLDTYRQKQAGEWAGKFDSTPAELALSFKSGFDSGLSGVVNATLGLMGKNPIQYTSAAQYASGEMRQNDKFLWGVANDFASTTGNQVPSLLAGAVNPTAGAITLGLSAGGNKYAEIVERGYGREEALATAATVGSLEAVLGKLLGGISKYGGISTWTDDMVKGISKAGWRVAADLGIKIGGESLEEGLQAVLEPLVENSYLGTNNKVDWEQVGYEALLGGLSAGLLEGIPMGVKMGTQNVTDTIGMRKAAVDTFGNKPQELVSKSLELNPQNKVALKAQERINAGKNVSGKNILSMVESNEKLLSKSNNKKTVSEQFAEHRAGMQTETSATVKGTDKKADIRSIEIDDNRVEFVLSNGEKVSRDKMSFSDEKQAAVADIAAEKTSRVKGFTAEAATAMIKGYDGSVSVSDYNAAINDAYRYGYQGIPIKELTTGKNTSLIKDKTPLYVAYDTGKRFAETSLTRPSFLESKSSDTRGMVMLDKSVEQMKLNKKQKSQIKALDIVAGGLGVNINVFNSPTNAQGQHIGENGRYHAETRTLDIDLSSGAHGQGVMLNTASHEITHHVRSVASDKFKAFADAVFEEFGNAGESVDALIEKRLKDLRENGRLKDLSEAEAYDLAYEEVVADAAESMLTDSDALISLSERIKANDKTLWDKIKDFIGKIVSDVKAIYNKFTPDSYEGAFVRDMGTAAERLQKLWVEGVMAASDVAYSSPTVNNPIETVNTNNEAIADFVDVDNTSKSVSPTMFSERTWTASEYVTKRDEKANQIASKLGVPTSKAKKYIDDISSVAKMIADDRTRLDYDASEFGSAFVSNSEYGGSFDYTTLCPKRRLYTGTFQEIQKHFKNTALSPDDILKIRNLMIEDGVEATCGLCYVEGSRANMGKFSKKFIELYARDNPGAWIPDMVDVNTPDGVDQMRINHPEAYEQYEYFWNHYGKLKDSDPALFASQQKPKLYESRKEYKGEILEHFKSDESIENKNRNGGIRMQSFSDFELVHLIDTMQVIMDMSSVGLAGQAYTKVPDFAKALGNTGLKINLSLIAKDVDSNGKLIFDDREGMNHETAFELRNQYSKDVGTILVAFTDEQLYAAMADDRVDFIIPFHRSQWKKGQYGAMGLPKGTKDYTYMQNEKLIKPTYHEYRGRMVRDKAKNYMPNEYWDFSKSGKENAEAYLKMCAENNKRPKFYKLLDYDGNGAYSLKKDGSTDGYWKLLIDFKMYDNDGVGSPQNAVVPEFNMDESIKMLNEYEGGHSQYPVDHKVVDKFVSEYEKGETVKYSDRVSPEESFSNRSILANALESVAQNDKEAKRLIDYKSKIARLNEEEAKLSKIKAEIKELTFGKGNKNIEKLKALKEEARVTQELISKYDKKLLSLEATEALKGLLQREKQNAYKRAAEKGREALHNNVEGRRKSDARDKIKKLKQKFQDMIDSPTESVYVPRALISAIVDVCDIVDTSSPLYKANGSINKAQQARNEARDRLIKLRDEYNKIESDSDAMIAQEYDEEIAAYLDELRKNYEGKNITDMTLDELNELYHTMRSIDETLKDARMIIREDEALDVYVVGDDIADEQRKIASKRKNGKRSSVDKLNDVMTNQSLSPMRAVLKMAGYNEDSAMYQTMRDIEKGVRVKEKFVMDANKSFENLTTGKNSKKYESAMYDAYGKELIDKAGRKFKVSKMQMMQAIMSYDRELANDKLKHVSTGGFTFADLNMLNKGKLRQAISAENAHTVNFASELALQFAQELANDTWAQEYMETARKFFDETAKKAINDANMKLKHRIVATGSKYIPYEVDQNFVVKEITSENDIQQVISGYGMLKDIKQGAAQPIIITGLNNILDRHISQVGNVHGLAVPIRNFNKIWNVKTESGNTVKQIVDQNWGKGGVDIITQAVKDVQGSRVRKHDIGEEIYNKAKSGVISAQFALNGSVVTKQIGSMYAATSMINYRDPATMTANLLYTMANFKEIADEVDKYTATAWKRRQGLSDAELHTLMTEARKSKLGRLASKIPAGINPAKWITGMDSAVALSLWKYAKEDTAKRTGLEGEELMKAAADFYDDVIEQTQSMSDALHRPEIQKRDDILGDILGMYKTDLYQGAGQLRVALGKVVANNTKENRIALAKTIAASTSSICWGALMTSAFALLRYKVNPYRDDEDDEITVESWLKVAGADVLAEMFGYMIPLLGGEVAGSIFSAANGGGSDDVDSIVLSSVNDVIDAIESAAKYIDDGKVPPAKYYINIISKFASLFGVPANNVIRLVDAIKLHAEDIANGEFLSFEAGLTTPNSQRLYNAYIEGDADRIEKASRRYEDENEINAALRKELRENDERMQKIATAELLGDYKTSTTLEKEIIAENIFDKKEIVGKAIDAEVSYISDKLVEAQKYIDKGKEDEAKSIYKTLVRRGYSMEFIESYMQTSKFKSLYKKRTK